MIIGPLFLCCCLFLFRDQHYIVQVNCIKKVFVSVSVHFHILAIKSI